MKSIGIFYGSTTENTKNIALKLQEKFGVDVADVVDIANANSEMIKSYENLIFGTSTWGFGDLQDDWDDFFPQLNKIDFAGKKIALFGLGNAGYYANTFVNGMGAIYEFIANKADVVGFVSIDGYDFEESSAFVNNHFVGLPIDEENQSEFTNERLDAWVSQLKPVFLRNA